MLPFFTTEFTRVRFAAAYYIYHAMHSAGNSTNLYPLSSNLTAVPNGTYNYGRRVLFDLECTHSIPCSQERQVFLLIRLTFSKYFASLADPSLCPTKRDL